MKVPMAALKIRNEIDAVVKRTLQTMFGDDFYCWKLEWSRLKDGTSVGRIVGFSGGRPFRKGDELFYKGKKIVTADDIEEQGGFVSQLAFRMLNHGRPELVEQQLQTALDAIHHNAQVSVNHDSYSIAVKIAPAPPSPPGFETIGLMLTCNLPKPGTVWPMAERIRWLRSAASLFDLVYTEDKGCPPDEIK